MTYAIMYNEKHPDCGLFNLVRKVDLQTTWWICPECHTFCFRDGQTCDCLVSIFNLEMFDTRETLRVC